MRQSEGRDFLESAAPLTDLPPAPTTLRLSPTHPRSLSLCLKYLCYFPAISKGYTVLTLCDVRYE